jgi:signal transduction histidine kinase
MAAQPLRRLPEAPAEARVRELEAALAEERQRLADLLEVSPGWIWETGADSRLSHLAGRFEATTGISPRTWLGRPVGELVSAAADGSDPAAEIGARRAFTSLTGVAASPHGPRHLSLSGKPWFDAAGRFAGYRGVGRDVTEVVEAETRSTALHRRFIEAIESVPASLLLCDPDDRIVICNSATRRYFPRVQHLLVPGTRFEDLVRGQAESGVLDGIGGDVSEWVAARMMRHRAADLMTTRPHIDGSWVQIIERRTSDGGIIGIRIDVTELKEREAALAEETERAAAYARELERSNGELEQFAYIASHDLQEPLRMVASYCQLLQRRYGGKLDKDADEFIAFAVEGAQRMQRLINDLLGYSRVGRGGGGSEDFAAAQAFDIAVANLQGVIAENGARVEAERLPTIIADRGQIVQLFQNLIANAIKFRRDEPPVVRISAAREPVRPGAPMMSRFTVADNGIGIAPEYLDRVFLIFQRLHERSKYPGTGIGLAIAHKVVENHGGRIWIESTPGEGSRFHFTLPLGT